MSDIPFMPHGQCMMWNVPLLVLHVLGDVLIALAYFTIPIALIYFLKKRRDLPFKFIYGLFAAFILSCGISHVVAIVTIWHPDYWTEGAMKMVTAIISVGTAFALWPAIPVALRIPSRRQLEEVNTQLADQIKQREKAEIQLQQLNDILKMSLDEKERDAREAAVELKKMQKQMLTVCAWTKRIKDEGNWLSFEQFMNKHMHLNFTHGISEEAAEEFRKQVKEASEQIDEK